MNPEPIKIPDQDVPFVRLDRHLDISRYGSEIMQAGDLNGDGQIEFVFYQGPGMLAASQFKPGASGWYGRHTTVEDQALNCLTAIDINGRVLWQSGEPWNRDIPFRTHGGHDLMLVDDLDGDGRDELVVLRGNRLQLIEGCSGRVLRQTTLDDDGYSQLRAVPSGVGRQKLILVRPISDGLNGHPHGCPNSLFDNTLQPRWTGRDFTRAGHVPLAFDVDGDGRAEILIGLDCLGTDGVVRWTITGSDLLPESASYFSGHDDRRFVGDIDGDGRLEQVLAFEHLGLIVSDLQGRILWRRPVPNHCGEACVGKFRDALPGLQILMNNERVGLPPDPSLAGSELLDGKGHLIQAWADDLYGVSLAWPSAVGPESILAAFHFGDNPDMRPFVMDGTGRVLAQFDIPRRLLQIADYSPLPQENLWPGDWGDYYCRSVLNIPGSGQRILIWTRRDLWIFAVEAKPAV